MPRWGAWIPVEFLGFPVSFMANDNMDSNWNNLAFIMKNSQHGLIRLCIEGSNVGCH